MHARARQLKRWADPRAHTPQPPPPPGTPAIVAQLASATQLSATELRAKAIEGWAARERMLRQNVQLIPFTISKIKPSASSAREAKASGLALLRHAVDTFKPGRNTRFSTWAVLVITRGIRRELESTADVVRLPSSARKQLGQVGAGRPTACAPAAAVARHCCWPSSSPRAPRPPPLHPPSLPPQMTRAYARLLESLGRTPTLDEVAAASDMSRGRVEELQRVALQRVHSLEALEDADDGEGATSSLIAELHDADGGSWSTEEGAVAPGGADAAALVQLTVDELLQLLSPGAARLVAARFGLMDGQELTLAEIARLRATSPCTVGSQVARSLQRLRTLNSQALRLAYASGGDA